MLQNTKVILAILSFPLFPPFSQTPCLYIASRSQPRNSAPFTSWHISTHTDIKMLDYTRLRLPSYQISSMSTDVFSQNPKVNIYLSKVACYLLQ